MPGSLGFGEILVIVLVALLVFGPRKLPEMGRTVGKALRQFRDAASDLKAEIEDDVEVEPPTVKSDWQRRKRDEAGEPPD
jgi:TatA/E family protein of Tat protein translocase